MFRYMNIYLTILRLCMAIKSSLLTKDSIDLHQLEKCDFYWWEIKFLLYRSASWGAMTSFET